MMQRPKRSGPEQTGPSVSGAARRLSVTRVGQTNAEMEKKAFKAAATREEGCADPVCTH